MAARVSAADDAAVVDALVAAEVALARAQAGLGLVPHDAAAGLSETFGWVAGASTCRGHGIDPAQVASAAAASGSPVLPLVAAMRDRAGDAAGFVHRGATSQDILDTALMVVATRAGGTAAESLSKASGSLTAFAGEHRDLVSVARTLTQHAGPTTVGLRASQWVRALRRAESRLHAAIEQAPAQLGGASGTLASFVELARAEVPDPTTADEIAAALPAAFARELGLAAPDAPWHTVRWPVTELGDALVQAIDACGMFATDVANLGRTEIGELTSAADGRSSAMPHKRNPTAAILIRGAAIRAPHLGATLHTAAALAVDERPDGAWHAEWPVLQELLSLALAATAATAELAAGLGVDAGRIAANVATTGGLVVSERLALVLAPVIGAGRVEALVAQAVAGADLAALLRAEPGLDGVDVDGLLDPAAATGLAARLVDGAEHPGH